MRTTIKHATLLCDYYKAINTGFKLCDIMGQ